MSEHAGVGRRRWWPWAAGGVALVVAVVVGVSVANRGASSAPDASPTDAMTSTSTTASTTAPEPTSSAPSPATVEPTAPPPSVNVPTAVVPLDAEAELTSGVTARVSAIEPVTGEAGQPGEVGGPALRVTVEVANATGAAVDLRGGVVNLAYGPSATPAAPIAQPGGEPLPQEVAAGSTARGVYVFTVPAESRDVVRVEVDVRLGNPIPVFEGSAPR